MVHITVTAPNQFVAANYDFESLSGTTRSKPVPHSSAYHSIPPCSCRPKYQPPAHGQSGLSRGISEQRPMEKGRSLCFDENRVM